MIPLFLSFFNDRHILVHIAFLMHPQLGDNALEKLALDYVEEDEEGADVDVDGTGADADIEVLEVPPPSS